MKLCTFAIGMSNDYFQFRKFLVHQELCAMKVGTDGVMLGAWAKVEGAGVILDIGTGSGLISLMSAQRNTHAHVVGIDISSDAVGQANLNFKASPWSDRLTAILVSLQDYYPECAFDSIISNPPYFVNSLKGDDVLRNLARHTDSLTYEELCRNAYRLLSEVGEFSVVVPSETCNMMEHAASLCGFFICRKYGVRTVARKPVRRFLLSFAKHSPSVFENVEVSMDSLWYKRLCEEFYL